MKYRLVIIGDSLAMPRPEVPYELTYPYLLKGKLGPRWEVINRARRANRIDVQMEEQNLCDDIFWLEPDIVVVHLGIVDCAPRLFSVRQRHLLERIPAVVRYRIIGVASRHRAFLTKHFPKQYVPLGAFEQLYEALIARLRNLNMYTITCNIADTSEKNKSRSFGFAQNIRMYNRVIEDASWRHGAKLIDCYRLSREIEGFLLEDGIHLSPRGAMAVAEEICLAVKTAGLMGCGR